VRESEGALVPATGWERPSGALIIQAARLATIFAIAVVFGEDVLHAGLVGLIFAVCVERTAAATHEALGAAAAVTGALAGLLVSLSLAAVFPSLGLGGVPLLGTAAATCVFVPLVEHVLRRLCRRRVLFVGPQDVADRVCAELAARTTYNVVVVPDASADGVLRFYDQTLARVPPNELSDEGAGVELQRRRRTGARVATRTFDVVFASLGLVLTAPLWPLLALLAVRRPGGVFLEQRRVGAKGRVFGMYKFRTMGINAEPRGLAVWAQADDPRVSWRGRILRETHLDELPQLWNVLKGDMSIVGPRPERPELEPMLAAAIPHWRLRQLAKPGLTGWAQVRQGYADDCDASERKLSYDLWYLRHRSLLLDLAICLRTVPTVVLRSGAR
jgi:lipopolysaccharide/colanic/teichoic acid biosynthesis glycosyltransferase